MKLGVFTYGPLEKRIAAAKAIGVDGIALLPVDFQDPSEVDVLVKKLEDEGLEFAQAAAWPFNPLRADCDKEALAIKMIKGAGRVGGSCTVIFGSGGYDTTHAFTYHPDNWSAESIQKSAKNIRPLAKVAEAEGTRIALEPHYSNVASSPEVSLELLELIGSEAVGMNGDFFNYCSMLDYHNPENLMRSIHQNLGGRCFAGHLKDLKVVNQVHLHIDECPAGEGNMDYSCLLPGLDQLLSKEDWGIIEHTPEDQLQVAVDYIRAQAEKVNVSFVSKVAS